MTKQPCVSVSSQAIINIAIVIAVAIILGLFWLIYGVDMVNQSPKWVGYLPHSNAIFNVLATGCLCMGVRAIRHQKVDCHRRWMMTALLCSALFLLGYLAYHTFQGHTVYTGVGWVRLLYFFVLVTHVLGTVVALPFILITVTFAYLNRLTLHRAWAKITWPLWLYVSVSGVVVYLFR